MMKKIYAFFIVIIVYHTHISALFIGLRSLTRYKKFTMLSTTFYSQFDKAHSTIYNHTTSYGVTKNAGFILNVPLRQVRSDGIRSTGIGDVTFLGQWQFYKQLPHLGIVNVGIKFPTRSTKELPLRDQGAFSYIFDVSGVHASQHWFAQTRFVGVLHGKHKKMRAGGELVYALSGGVRLPLKDSAIYAFLSMTGNFAKQSTFNIEPISATGGNVIVLGPTVAWQKPNYFIGGNISLPIAQTVRGDQARLLWTGSFVFQIKF